MTRLLRCALIALASAGAGVLAGAGWLAGEIARVFAAPLVLDAPRLVTIAPGTGLEDIARQLEAEGWISDARLLSLRARYDGTARKVKAGTYEARPGDTLDRLLARMIAGQTKVFHITFIEGCTFADMRRVLADAPHLRHTLRGLEPPPIMAALGITEVAALEGQFFPDTYAYAAGTRDLEILRRAHQRLRELLDDLWQDRAENLPYRSPYEVLIMASIIEKETGRAEERAAIAGVFTRRLVLGMKLQTDPTVIYGLGSAFDGDLRRADLARDTPYNTYTRSGLPPTPIAMPGGHALAAALAPAPGSALYFVAKGDGAHHFSDTLTEHNAAVRRYQLRAAR